MKKFKHWDIFIPLIGFYNYDILVIEQKHFGIPNLIYALFVLTQTLSMLLSVIFIAFLLSFF